MYRDAYINIHTGVVQGTAGPEYTNPYESHPDWKKLDGGIVKIEDFPELYNIIGTSYGKGNNPGEFRLPDYRGRIVTPGEVEMPPEEPSWPEYIIYEENSAVIKILRRLTHDKDNPRYQPYMTVQCSWSEACEFVERANAASFIPKGGYIK